MLSTGKCLPTLISDNIILALIVSVEQYTVQGKYLAGEKLGNRELFTKFPVYGTMLLENKTDN